MMSTRGEDKGKKSAEVESSSHRSAYDTYECSMGFRRACVELRQVQYKRATHCNKSNQRVHKQVGSFLQHSIMDIHQLDSNHQSVDVSLRLLNDDLRRWVCE